MDLNNSRIIILFTKMFIIIDFYQVKIMNSFYFIVISQVESKIYNNKIYFS